MKHLSRSVQPGDLFYMPAINANGDHGFVMARYIELLPTNVGHLIEVFAKFHDKPPRTISEVEKNSRLFNPIMFDLYFQYIPKWRILFSDPQYEKSQSNYENITIAFHNHLWIGGKGNIPPTYPNQLKEYEGSTCWRTHHIIFRVNAHLAGIFGSNDKYDYHLAPLEYRFDTPSALEEVVSLAKEIDEKFGVWSKQNGKRH